VPASWEILDGVGVRQLAREWAAAPPEDLALALGWSTVRNVPDRGKPSRNGMRVGLFGRFRCVAMHQMLLGSETEGGFMGGVLEHDHHRTVST
jgi:hypothetical protein